MGGAVAAVENGYFKLRLVEAHSLRRARIESGEEKVVGVNCFTESEPSPLVADLDAAVQTLDPAAERAAADAVRAWRSRRDRASVEAALDALRAAANGAGNLMPPTLACARAGVTTGEWAQALREVYGEYRAPTGIAGAPVSVTPGSRLAAVRARVHATGEELGSRLRLLIGKPGLDGHSNGAEQIAVRARDAGFEVVYEGIRLTPAQIAAAAVAEDVHCVRLSILSGAHGELVPEVLRLLGGAGGSDLPVVVGIIPDRDAARLRSLGVAAVFTPRDYDATEIMSQIVDVIRDSRTLQP